MDRGPTLFLKIIISLVAIGALAVCIFALPAIANDDAARHPDLAYQKYPFLAYAYTVCAIFFFALYQAFKLLSYVEANKAFSESTINALKYIKYCAFAICTLIVAGVGILMIMSIGTNEDMAGIIMMGMITTLISLVGATVVAVLQRHVQKAVDLKSENDLTV